MGEREKLYSLREANVPSVLEGMGHGGPGHFFSEPLDTMSQPESFDQTLGSRDEFGDAR